MANKYYVLFNPYAGKGECKEDVSILEVFFDEKLIFHDVLPLHYKEFLSGLLPEDKIILCGGDGTVHRFVNELINTAITNEIYFFPDGCNNDFARDLGKCVLAIPTFCINKYLNCLPVTHMKGSDYRFLNGIIYGVKGFCRPSVTVSVTVDNRHYQYKKVCMVAVMNGRFAGGWMLAPEQQRLGQARTLSLVVLRSTFWSRVTFAVSSITGARYDPWFSKADTLTGHDITIEFDQPVPLQIDGENIQDVRRYTAHYEAFE